MLDYGKMVDYTWEDDVFWEPGAEIVDNDYERISTLMNDEYASCYFHDNKTGRSCR